MVEEPDRLAHLYVEAGCQRLIVHAEACLHLHRVLGAIAELGATAGGGPQPGHPDRPGGPRARPGRHGAGHDRQPRLRRPALHRLHGAEDRRAGPPDRRPRGSTSTSRSTAASPPPTVAGAVAAGANVLVAGSALFADPGRPRPRGDRAARHRHRRPPGDLIPARSRPDVRPDPPAGVRASPPVGSDILSPSWPRAVDRRSCGACRSRNHQAHDRVIASASRSAVRVDGGGGRADWRWRRWCSPARSPRPARPRRSAPRWPARRTWLRCWPRATPPRSAPPCTASIGPARSAPPAIEGPVAVMVVLRRRPGPGRGVGADPKAGLRGRWTASRAR